MGEPVCARCGWVRSNHKGPPKKGFCTEFVEPEKKPEPKAPDDAKPAVV